MVRRAVPVLKWPDAYRQRATSWLLLALCPRGRDAVYFLIGIPDLLNDAKVQVVVRGDPADAAIAVHAQQGAVLGPCVAGRVWSDPRHDAAATGEFRGTHRRFSISVMAEGWPRRRVQFRDGNRHSHWVGRAQ